VGCDGWGLGGCWFGGVCCGGMWWVGLVLL